MVAEEFFSRSVENAFVRRFMDALAHAAQAVYVSPDII